MPTLLARDTTEYLLVPLAGTDESGTAINPLGPPALAVQMAVLPKGDNDPDEPDWRDAEWESGVDEDGNIIYRVRCLFGPGATPPFTWEPGEYSVWVRVFDNPETPVKRAGIIVIY